jgi:hypothetical protein
MQAQRYFVRYAKQQLLPLLAKNRAQQYCQTPRRSFLSNEKALRILGLGSTGASSAGGAHQQVHVHLLTQAQLRKAYLAAAKRYHPDTISTVDPVTTVAPSLPWAAASTATTTTTTIGMSSAERVTTSDQEEEDMRQRRAEAAKKFHLVAEAFEALQSRISGSSSSSSSWWRRSGYDDAGDDDDGAHGDLSSYEEEQSFRRACIDVLQVPAHIVEEAKRDPAFLQWLQGNTDAAHLWRDFLHQHGGMAPMLATSDAQQPSFLPLKGGGPVRRSRRR